MAALKHEHGAIADSFTTLNPVDAFEQFSPFNIDYSPLQKFLITLAKQVEQLQKDNVALRDELAGLKVSKRLESLETGMQELAENLRPNQGYQTGGPGFGQDGASGAAGSAGAAGAAGAGGVNGANGESWVLMEFSTVKDRIGAIERRAEALWHVKEDGQELRGLVDRLKADVDGAQTLIADTQSAARHAHMMAEKLEAVGAVTKEQLEGVVDKVNRLELNERKAAESQREGASKLESHVNSIWDQIRHVENSLSQRLTLAETSQVSTLQEVDDMKEAAAEVGTRLDESRRHVAALESKLESFNTQVAAALSPLHNSLAAVQLRLDELAERKQDREKALTVDDVNAGVARAIDHADRRADNIIKSIGAMEERVEELNDAKANRADVVLAVDLQALLVAHASELDGRLGGLRGDMVKALGLKADREEVAALEQRQGARLASLEGAILKGLKAISDRVSAALAEKLDLTAFNEFKVQVRAILADVEDRLRDWSPAARGMKAPMDGSGATGATSCLCCDQRVRSVRDLQSMGFPAADRVFAPEKLPATEPLLPAINRSPDVAAHVNARVAARRKDQAGSLLRQSAAPVLESLPAAMPGAGSPTSHNTLSTVDPAALLGAKGDTKGRAPAANSNLSGGGAGPDTSTAGNKGAGAMQVEVETISGAISQGRIPSTRGPGRGPSKPRPGTDSQSVSPWSPSQSQHMHSELNIDMMSRAQGSPDK